MSKLPATGSLLDRFYADERPFPQNTEQSKLACNGHQRITHDLTGVFKHKEPPSGFERCRQKRSHIAATGSQGNRANSGEFQVIREKPKSSYKTRSNLSASKLSRDP